MNPFPTIADESQLLHELKYSKAPTKVYCLLDTNKNSLKAEHIVTAVKSLILITKRYKYDLHYKNDIYQKVNKIIHSNLDRLQVKDAVKIMEYLARTEDKTDFNSLNLLLNYITVNIDSLKIEDYSKLAAAVVRMVPSRSTELLLEALKLNFSKKFLLEFDANDQQFLINSFLFAARNITDTHVLNQIIEPLSTKEIELNFKDSVNVFINAILLHNIPGSLNIFNAAKKIILENLDNLNSNQITFIFLKYSPLVKEFE